jgi:hypothetical protein
MNQLTNEVKSTLVIGLGGTGSLGVKKVKEKMHPKFVEVGCVRYLVFDTTSQERRGVYLTGAEFFDIGRFNANRILDTLDAEGRYISDWFPNNLRPGQINLGAMGIRPIGRLCYFVKREEKIRPVVQARLKEITDKDVPLAASKEGFTVDLDRGIDIHLISSVCGGTGAGMLLDFVYDLRRWAEEIAKTVTISAHLVLPEAFDIRDAQAMSLLQANAYAVLKEIDYFTKEGGWNVKYRDEAVEMKNRVPFDFCYLLNGERKTDTIDRDRLTAIIGEAIVVFITSPVGKSVGDTAINLAIQVLSQLDDTQKPRAYSSYGVSIGEIPYEKMYELGREALIKEFVNAITKQRVLESELEKEIEIFTSTSMLSPERLKDYEPRIASLRFGGLSTVEKNKAKFKAATRELIENYKNKNEFERIKSERKLEELKERAFTILEDKTTTYLNHKDKRLSFVLTFLEQLEKEFERFRESFKESAKELCEKEEKSQQELNEHLKSSIDAAKIVELEERLARPLEESEAFKHIRMFYQSAYDVSTEMIDHIQQMLSRYRRMVTLLEDLKQPVYYKYKREVTKLPPERFSICEVKDVMEAFKEHKEKIIEEFLSEIEADLISLSNESITAIGDETRAKLDQLCIQTLSRVLDKDPAFNCQTLLFAKGKEKAEKILVDQINIAVPAWRVDDAYPMENIRNISVVGAERDSEVADLLNQLDANIVPTGIGLRNEIPIMQTEHGLSLWGLAKMRDYQKAFYKVQSREEKTNHQLHLDRRWNYTLPDIFPEKPEDPQALESFTLCFMFGWIKKRGLDYEYSPEQGEGIILDEDRYKSFLKFRDFKERNLIDEVYQRVREKMREINDNQQAIKLLDQYTDSVEKLIEKTQDDENKQQIWRERKAIERFKEKLLSE